MNLLPRTLIASFVLSVVCAGSLYSQEITTEDLAAIRKTTSQKLVEPQYEHSPKYAMVVTGREATNRIYMVLDGFTTIYADVNGDGTLDPETEKFLATESYEYPEGKRHLAKHQFRFGEVDGHHLSMELFVPSETFTSNSKPIQNMVDQHRENGWVRSWLGRTEERVKYEGMTMVVFTPKAEDAQVAWLGGPLSMVATDRDLRPRKKLGVPLKTDDYTVTIGCIGLPIGDRKGLVITPIIASELPKDVFPVSSFQFESGVVEVQLDSYFTRGQIKGQFLLPKGEWADEVEVETSFPPESNLQIRPVTQTISIK